eukprot:2212928-Pyramimonas_sp.AAC.1
MGTEAMLLDDVSHAEATSIGRWGYNANIDSLPYADELPEHWKDEVEKEIRLESYRTQTIGDAKLAAFPYEVACWMSCRDLSISPAPLNSFPRPQMRRSTKTPKDYLAELPPFPPT